MAREVESVGGEEVDWLTDGLAREPSDRQVNKIQIKEDLERLDEMTSIDEVSDLLERLKTARVHVRTDLETFHLKARSGMAQPEEFKWSGKARVALHYLDKGHERTKKHLNQLRHEELVRTQQAKKAAKAEKDIVPAELSETGKEDFTAIVRENNRNARLKMKLKLVQDLRWERHFVNCAREMLSAEDFIRIKLAADKGLMDALDAADV